LMDPRLSLMVGAVCALITQSMTASGALPGGAWRLHFTGIVCRSAPCPDWKVQDRSSGLWFSAVVHFVHPVDAHRAQAARSGTVDLLADGERSELTMSGRRYSLMSINRVAGEAAATAEIPAQSTP